MTNTIISEGQLVWNTQYWPKRSTHLLRFYHVPCLPAEEQWGHACSTCRRNSETRSSQFSGGTKIRCFCKLMIMFKAETCIVSVLLWSLRPLVLLTLVDASMFSGSMRVLSSPISCTAPPNSGSESQIICLITTFISRTSYKEKCTQI